MPIQINELQIKVPGQDPLQQALARIAQLEVKVAALQAALSVNATGEVTLKGRTLTLQADQKISIQSASVLELSAVTMKASASSMEANASIIRGNSALSHFSGVIKCDVIQANTVIGASYTPGAGNLF
jgi:hypothetical protein